MPDKKLTDNEIVKALECCCSNDGCNGCPCRDGVIPCFGDKDILSLINRQQAEIERLQKVSDIRIECLGRCRAKAKAEAYKEFAEMLISKIADVMKHIERNPYDSKDETNGTICGLAHAIGRIKDLLKEKVGENNA